MIYSGTSQKQTLTGQKKFDRFREVSALERFCLFWLETGENPTPITANLLGIPIIPFTPLQ